MANWLITIHTPEEYSTVHVGDAQACIEEYKEQVIDKGFTQEQLGEDCGQIHYCSSLIGTLRLDGSMLLVSGHVYGKDMVEHFARPVEL